MTAVGTGYAAAAYSWLAINASVATAASPCRFIIKLCSRTEVAPFDIDNTEALCRACHEEEHKIVSTKERSNPHGKAAKSAREWKSYLERKSAAAASTES